MRIFTTLIFTNFNSEIQLHTEMLLTDLPTPIQVHGTDDFSGPNRKSATQKLLTLNVLSKQKPQSNPGSMNV